MSRMRYIAAQMDRPVRFLGLSTALANAADLADWLAISKRVCVASWISITHMHFSLSTYSQTRLAYNSAILRCAFAFSNSCEEHKKLAGQCRRPGQMAGHQQAGAESCPSQVYWSRSESLAHVKLPGCMLQTWLTGWRQQAAAKNLWQAVGHLGF